MKTIFLILAFTNTAMAAGGYLSSDGLNRAVGDSIYVNSPTESDAQTFEGVTQFGSGTTKSTFTATGTLQMGSRTQTIGYAPVVVSSTAENTLATVLGASKVCISTQSAATFLGGRFQHILGHVNVNISASGSSTISQTLEIGGSVIHTDVLTRPASVDDMINIYHPIASSTAGSNVFRVCYTTSGSGVATVTNYAWAVIEW